MSGANAPRMTHENPKNPRRHRMTAGKPLALGVLALPVMALVFLTIAPVEPTPTPPRLPPPAESGPAPEPETRPAVEPPILPEAESPADPLAAGAPEPSVPEPSATASPPRSVDAAAARREVQQTCERIAARLGSVSLDDCLGSRLDLSGARSTQGTPILLAEYPPMPQREPLGRVLLFGGIHGDELSSVSIVYSWLDILERFHSGLFHWRIAPLVNPDGLLRRPAQRMNDRGVDLNRNFPSPNWKIEASDYWIRRTSRNPRRYPGEAPLSEPESRWLHDQIDTFRPAAIVAVHAPLHVLDYDGPLDPPQRLGPLYLKQMGTYPGSLGRFAGVHLGLPVVTLELPSAGIMPTPADQRRMWVDLVTWLRENVPKQNPVQVARADPAPPAPAPGAQR